MRKRTLGRTGLKVTELGYGAGQLRGTPRIWSGRPVSAQQAETILNAVLDAGINFIDTSNVYGRSEEFIGRFISHRRDEFFLATKCGREIIDKGDHDETPLHATRAVMERTINDSLKRLNTDYVDLLQLHTPTRADLDTYSEMVQVLQEAQQAGKTRFIGASVTLPHLPHYFERDAFDTFQIPYSALERNHEEWLTIIDHSQRGVIIRGGVAQGKAEQIESPGAHIWERAQLDDLLDGMSRMAFMLRFTLTHPAAHTTIVATINPDHLQENLKAAAMGPLPDDVYEEAKRRLTEQGETPIPV